MLKKIALFSAVCGSIAGLYAADLPEYRVNEWQALDRGKHRAVITVNEDTAVSPAVRVYIPWRRRDHAPEKKQILVFAEKGDLAVKNVATISCEREYGDIIFAPAAGAGRYFIYYLPYPEPTYYFGDPGEYYLPEDTADPFWKSSALAAAEDLPSASVEAIEAFSEFDSFYPMEIPATAAEMQEFFAEYGSGSMMLFPESRELPIRMNDELPVHWLAKGPGRDFRGSARPNEYYAFQIGVYAAGCTLPDLQLEMSDLVCGTDVISKENFECINLEGVDPYGNILSPQIVVAENMIQPLWIILQVPEDASGIYSGRATVTSSNGMIATVGVEIEISGDILEDSGVSDITSMARLHWLNSTIGTEKEVFPPFTPVETDGNTVNILDRTITFGANGLPTSVSSRNRELLREPVSFTLYTENGRENFDFSPAEITEHNDSYLERTISGTSPSFALRTTTKTEFDGCIHYFIKVTALHDIDISDAVLDFRFRTEEVPYSMGLGLRGGYRPESRVWDWTHASAPSLWMGSADAGMQICLESDNRISPPERWQDDAPPAAWSNNNYGFWVMEEVQETTASTIHSGSMSMKAGEEKIFHFRMLVTPFKPVNKDHWDWRFMSQWGGSGDMDSTMTLLFHGDSSCGNAYINYPFLQEDVMKNYIDNMVPDASTVLYPAAGIAAPAEGSITLWLRPLIPLAHCGPGTKGYNLWTLQVPGGDALSLHWHPAKQSYVLHLRKGFDGLRPITADLATLPVTSWEANREVALSVTWQGENFRIFADGRECASGSGLSFPDTSSLAQTMLGIVNSPVFAISAAAVSSVAEPAVSKSADNANLTFYDDFRNIYNREVIPAFAANNSTGTVKGTAIVPGTEYPLLQPDGLEKKPAPILYYAARELSNHAAELWALRSLTDDVFHATSLVYAVDGVKESASGGGYPWLKEHLRSGYAPAWRMPMGKFNDASLSTGISRWHNYYIEGMDYLMRNCGVEGLYLDGVGYDRNILQRMVKVMKKRNPDAHVNVHYVDAYNQLGRLTSASSMYMEFWPYVDSLWFGELFSYDLGPDFWLVELSGIPFGLSSEMLNYQNGGNPWRGMVYGMSSRMLPSANAMWHYWDVSGIKESTQYGYWDARCPMTTDRDDVKYSLYDCGNGKVIAAIAHWPRPGAEEVEKVVPFAASTPSLAGEMTPQWWEDGAVINGFNLVGTDSKVEGIWNTEVRIMRDDNYLYVGFQCGFSGELKMFNTARDSNIFSDDSVDLFFGDQDGNTVHYILNAAGGIWDAKNGDTTWDSDIYYRTWVGKNIWDNQIWHGTARIPLEVFGSNVSSLRFNACRTSFSPATILSSWAPVQEYNDSAKWGRLLLERGATAKETVVEKEIPVRLNIDFAALGLDPSQIEVYQPQINYFQPAKVWDINEPVIIPNSAGAVLEITAR